LIQLNFLKKGYKLVQKVLKSACHFYHPQLWSIKKENFEKIKYEKILLLNPFGIIKTKDHKRDPPYAISKFLITKTIIMFFFFQSQLM
jgi:hypothetical protein